MAAPFVRLYDDIGTSVDRIKAFRLTMKNSMRIFLDECGLKTENPGLIQRDLQTAHTACLISHVC
ncbi:hypothetical protein [Pseudomonas syringae]|uniref:hypothetical protein n=1 Tax=Pseudomonas syringae TaxID=317 RepID=UPI00072FEE05|nr:hypothetical protein [Pseudomonas syringae]KTC05623.1 hypothetical protein AO386_03380 [Pseudomonas syringae ICMP 11292]